MNKNRIQGDAEPAKAVVGYILASTKVEKDQKVREDQLQGHEATRRDQGDWPPLAAAVEKLREAAEHHIAHELLRPDGSAPACLLTSTF